MRRVLTLLGLLAALGGCAALKDPFQRPDTYVATGVNDDNLRAMIVNPVDLQHGVGAPDTTGLNAAAAVARLRNDNVHPLPSSSLSDIGGGAGTGGQATGGTTGTTGGDAVMPDALVPVADTEGRAGRIPVVAFVRDKETESVMREVLGDLLRDGGQVRRGGIQDAKTGLQQMETPGALIVDVSGEKDPFVALEDLAQFVEPGVRVLVVGERADMEFYRQVTRGLGVLEYLCKPVNRDQISREFLPWIMGRGPSDVGSRGGRIIAVTGVRGGVGATTVAVNLAVELAERRRHHTLLLDADLQGGTGGLMLANEAEGGLRAALEHPERVDKLLVERAAPRLGDRLALLGAEDRPDSLPNVSAGAVRHLLDLLRGRYNCIVIDLPRLALPMHREMQDLAQQRVLVMDATLPSLRDALRMVSAYTGLKSGSPPLLVLNRLGAPGTLDKKQVIAALQRAPDIIIPFMPKQLHAATTLGEPAVRKRGPFQSAIATLAHEILPAPVAEVEVKRGGGGLMKWLRK